MRWSIYVILLFVAIILDEGFRQVIRFWDSVPSFTSIAVVFVAFFAPRLTALWAAWIGGLLVDLMTDLPHGAHDVGPLLGPHAFGFTAATFVLLSFRSMLLRRRALTIVVIAVGWVALANLVVAALYGVHGLYESTPLHWADPSVGAELARRLRCAVYTGVIAIAIAPILLWSLPLWSFRGSLPRRAA